MITSFKNIDKRSLKLSKAAQAEGEKKKERIKKRQERSKHRQALKALEAEAKRLEAEAAQDSKE